MPAILIKNGVAITMDRERNVMENASVLIRDDRIAALGDGDEISANVSLDEVIDARRMAILPGDILLSEGASV
jgi:predicted amidohydrolase YtcJ